MKPHCKPPPPPPSVPSSAPPPPPHTPPLRPGRVRGPGWDGATRGTLGHFITESVCPEDGKRIILQTGFIAGDNSSAEPAAGRARGPHGLRLQYCFIHSSGADLAGRARLGDVAEETRRGANVRRNRTNVLVQRVLGSVARRRQVNLWPETFSGAGGRRSSAASLAFPG